MARQIIPSYLKPHSFPDMSGSGFGAAHINVYTGWLVAGQDTAIAIPLAAPTGVSLGRDGPGFVVGENCGVVSQV